MTEQERSACRAEVKELSLATVELSRGIKESKQKLNGLRTKQKLLKERLRLHKAPKAQGEAK